MVPALLHLRAAQLHHMTDVSIHAWQGLVNLLLQLQGSPLDRGVAQLLLLLAQHAQQAQPAGVPSSQALQPAWRQPAGS